jgi:hypothetical protein
MELHKGIDLDPTDPYARQSLGLVYAKQGLAKEAEKTRREAWKYRPGNRSPEENLIITLYSIASGDATVGKLEEELKTHNPPVGVMRELLKDAQIIDQSRASSIETHKAVEVLNREITDKEPNSGTHSASQ